MTQEGFKRKLTAILSADVVGYSRLMDNNEELTVRTLNIYRDSMRALIRQHRGRVVDATGDNLLAEFTSVVDALSCSVKVQKELSERNVDLSSERRMEFRIGVNVGDVIEEEDRIYGDGVNIAARLERLAEPEGICISKTAFDHIESKLPYGYDFIGEQTVKNIAKPVGAYRVLMEPRVTISGTPEKEKAFGFRRMQILAGVVATVVLAVAVGIWLLYPKSPKVDSPSVEKPESHLVGQPSIAVLPFANMSNDPKQDYLCDGIADQIINSIAKIPYITVIARNSSFAYKGKSVDVQQITADLGVRYILEGSLQRDNENVRINTQLIDAETGRHLWTETYDRKLDDIFLVQDEICKNIMVTLQVKLTTGEMARIEADTVNIKAYQKYLKAVEHYQRKTWGETLIARQLFQEAIALDPGYAMAYLLVGWTYLDEVWFGMTKTPPESIARAEAMVQKAVSIQGFKEGENALLSGVHLLKKDLEKAITYAEKAVEQNPNSAALHHILGMALRSNGQYDEAISKFKKALLLNPMDKIDYVNNLAWAYLYSKQYEKAISTWNEILQHNPDHLFAYLGLTMAYWVTGAEDQARQAAQNILRINPKFSVGYYEKLSYLKDKALKEQMFDSWRKAGLK